MEVQRIGSGLYRVVRAEAERRQAYTLTRAEVQAIAARLGLPSVARELLARFDRATAGR